MSNLAGLCHICNNKTTMSCKLCGRPTCEKHLQGEICIICLRGKTLK